ncbi:MAG: hypothetical protein WBA71_07140 [Candidatus Humimicrobiia bacterium]
MTTPANLYVNGIRKKLKIYFAAWLPTEELRLGDVGILEGDFLKRKNFFKRITSLKNLGISFKERADINPTPLDLVSKKGVTVNVKFQGEKNEEIPILPIDKAGISFSFNNMGAFVFQSAESYEPTIENIATLQKQMIKEWEEKRWKDNWAVITKIVKVPYASYIISTSSDSEIVFETDVDLKKGLIDFGNAGINFTFKKQTGDVLKMIGAQNISPFFQLAKLKIHWLGLNSWGSIRASDSPPPPGMDRDGIIGRDDRLFAATTPEMVKENKEIEDSLYLDVISYNEQ